jgi:hypothetical protein
MVAFLTFRDGRVIVSKQVQNAAGLDLRLPPMVFQDLVLVGPSGPTRPNRQAQLIRTGAKRSICRRDVPEIELPNERSANAGHAASLNCDRV